MLLQWLRCRRERCDRSPVKSAAADLIEELDGVAGDGTISDPTIVGAVARVQRRRLPPY